MKSKEQKLKILSQRNKKKKDQDTNTASFSALSV